MSDTAQLEIKVLSDKVELASARLKKLEESGGKAEKATESLAGSFTKLVAPIAGVLSVTAGFSKLIEVNRSFDKLNAGLITATGSTEGAKEAFGIIQDFATATPYSLQQVTDSFIKLVNYGLTPSERAITSYGNTASALGKGLDQMVEAVADAATGQFERLKEFGIKSSTEGDKVKFTFRGITTTVGKSSKDIQDYLIKLGETNFGDAMARRMDTLDGALSNLGDAWDKLFLNIGQTGVGSIISDAVKLATAALEELNAMLASGELVGYLSAIGSKFSAFGKDAMEVVRSLKEIWTNNFKDLKGAVGDTVGFLIDAFKNLPENVRALIQIMVVEISSSFQYVQAYAKAFVSGLKAIFTDETFAEVGAKLQTELDAIQYTKESSIKDIMAEREQHLANFQVQIDGAKKAREEYDKLQAAKKTGGDRLAKYSKGGDGDSGPSKEEQAKEKQRKADYKKMVLDLRTEEETIRQSYDKRTDLINRYTKEGSDLRAKLDASSMLKYDEELVAFRKKQNQEEESLKESLRTEEESIQASYEAREKIINLNVKSPKDAEELRKKIEVARDKELQALKDAKTKEKDELASGLRTEGEELAASQERKRQEILSSTAVTEEERASLLKKLEEKNERERFELHAKWAEDSLKNSELLFGNLAQVAKNFGGEQSKAYKVLFAASKAFSIAQGAVSIATGLLKAQELGWPANIPAMIQVAATGAGIMAQITSASYSGAFDKGGKIGAGEIGLVGERRPEFILGPATVVGGQQTSQLMQSMSRPQSQSVKLVIAPDQATADKYMTSSSGERVMAMFVKRNAVTIRNMLGLAS
jgi:hypothetical protein